MKSTIPSHLSSTYELVEQAFPDGVEPENYFPLLAILSKEMSDRNLAETLAILTERDYSLILNDIYAVQSTAIPSAQAIEQVEKHLQKFGYQQWLESE